MADNIIGKVTPIWRGLYDAAERYALNDIVLTPDGSVWWHKGQDDTTGTSPFDSDIWAAVIDMSDFSGTVQAAIAEAKNALEEAKIVQAEISETSEAVTKAVTKAVTETEKSAAVAVQSANEAGTYATQAATSADTARAAANSMIYVSFTTNENGHLIMKNADHIGTTEFNLTKKGHMEVTL